MENVSEILGVIIVILPVFIFVLTMLVIKKRLGEQKIDLGGLLSEPDDQVLNKNGVPVAPPTPGKKSASRLILFLSGVTSLILGVCITSYYFYMTIYCIDCSSNLDLMDFTNVILALGIGVVPYAVNQVKKVKL
jgi:hypothetical protein